MIFAYYDENGILKETITKPVRVGDDDYDKVYLFFAGKDYDSSINAYPANVAEGSAITSTFRNSGDGIESVEAFSDTEILDIPFDPERDLKFFRYYTNYQFYVAEVPTSVLATSGSVSCTPRQIYADSHSRAYGTLIFSVEGGVVIADHSINTSQYNYLLTQIGVRGVFYPYVDANGILSWTNELGLENPPDRDIMGPGIESIEKIGGTGAPGTTDTYRITYSNGSTFDFYVANGANGNGVSELRREFDSASDLGNFLNGLLPSSNIFASILECYYDGTGYGQIPARITYTGGAYHLFVLTSASAPTWEEITVAGWTSANRGTLSVRYAALYSGGPAQSVGYITEAPTAPNTNGGLIFVVLDYDPQTKYDGYYYIITEE